MHRIICKTCKKMNYDEEKAVEGLFCVECNSTDIEVTKFKKPDKYPAFNFTCSSCKEKYVYQLDKNWTKPKVPLLCKKCEKKSKP